MFRRRLRHLARRLIPLEEGGRPLFGLVGFSLAGSASSTNRTSSPARMVKTLENSGSTPPLKVLYRLAGAEGEGEVTSKGIDTCLKNALWTPPSIAGSQRS
jgi:hypothetical protein